MDGGQGGIIGGVSQPAEFPADRTGVAVQRTGKRPDAAGAVVFTGVMQFQHDGGPLFGAQVGIGSGLFHGNTSYGDGVLHLKVESKLHSVMAADVDDDAQSP